ncbi:hypothetical protein [Frankia gtarii]|uniref:hypothetical protein n=1 Tax=Frankia gtarii TaxID=2950102 RepID=UPI0021C0BC04|nr:hypothetical protein [Frankia gtarii]
MISIDQRWLQVLLGPEGVSRSTRVASHTVLVVVHTVTALTRLLDVLPAFLGDTRLRILYTIIDGSPFGPGAAEFLADIGARVIPWESAVANRFDLAVAAGRSGDLHLLSTPLVVIPHGAGYNKYRKQETGNRKQETGNRKQVYGFAHDQLVHDGRVVPTAIVLSHAEQLNRLGRSCPQALPVAVVAGDPCYDRMLASRHRRREYRAVLGVHSDQKLIVLTSTWGQGSLLEQAVELPARIVTDLPMDEYRVVAAVHPNVWVHHGAFEVRRWLAEAMQAGLLLLPPREGWRAAIVAADLVVGDHGSVGVYAAALDRPVLLAAGDPAEVDPAGSTARLLRLAPVLAPAYPLRRQIDDAIGGHDPGRYAELAADTFALPGESLAALRSLLYRLMRLPEPRRTVRIRSVDPPTPEGRAPTAALVSTEIRAQAATGDLAVAVSRFPVADMAGHSGRPDADVHLAVDVAESDLGMLESADVLLRRTPTAGFPAEEWTASVLADYPGCRVAADVTAAGRCLLRLRHRPAPQVGPAQHDGQVYEVRQVDQPGGPLAWSAGPVAAETLVSAVYAWVVGGRPLDALARGVDVRVGALRTRITAGPRDDDADPPRRTS